MIPDPIVFLLCEDHRDELREDRNGRYKSGVTLPFSFVIDTKTNSCTTPFFI